MSRFIYSLLFYLALPLVLLRLLYRSIREPGYRQAVSQRFGRFQTSRDRPIWVHAVSAGETVAAAPLVQRLTALGYSCIVTNMTPTGRERVRELLGDTVENCYAPYDLPHAVNRFLAANQPRLMITIDTELWPNTLHACQQRSVPTMLVNGRLSARSAAGYARLGLLTVPMLRSITRLGVQTPAHAARFAELGVEPGRIEVTGSIKFDGRDRDDLAVRIKTARERTCDRPVLLAASTHEGEEAALLTCLPALLAVVPELLLVLAPRHTHRKDQVVGQCRQAGYEPVLFTSGERLQASDTILLVDTMGELDALFPIARTAFVGGSLVPVGGHNLLEAVRAGTPVVMGSHLRNIEDIAQQFVDANAMRVVEGIGQLKTTLVALMADAGVRAGLAEAATAVLEKNLGALDETLRLIQEVLDDGASD